MQIVRELPLHELMHTLYSMLAFDEDQLYWCYYEGDPDWWALRLYTRRN